MLVKGHMLLISGESNGSISASRSCTLNIDNEVIETAPQTAGYRSYISGMKGWSVSADGLYEISSASTMVSKLKAGSAVYIVLRANAGNTSEAYAGNAIVTNIQMTGSIEGMATYSVQLQGSGVLNQWTDNYVSGIQWSYDNSTWNTGVANMRSINDYLYLRIRPQLDYHGTLTNMNSVDKAKVTLTTVDARFNTRETVILVSASRTSYINFKIGSSYFDNATTANIKVECPGSYQGIYLVTNDCFSLNRVIG